MRHFLTLDEFSKEEILEIINLAKEIKKQTKNGIFKPYLEHKTLAMIFEKSSTRTRVSFETGIYQLGGQGIFLNTKDTQLGRGEPIKDTARVLSGMVDMAMLRVFKHKDLEEFAKFSKIPVINGLSDDFHPMQLLADFMTLLELGISKDFKFKVAYVGDGNNMSHSWAMLASKIGFDLDIATPKQYQPNKNIMDITFENSKKSGAIIRVLNDVKTAVKDADVVTTDTWISMGQESEKQQKVLEFDGFCVDDRLMSLAKKNAIFLHCLPAYRGYEVSDEVFEKHSDEIFLESENRLHIQKAVMVWLDRKRGN